MILATLVRDYKEDCTLGTLMFQNGLTLKTLERPWLGNEVNISCYPEGAYLVKYLPRSGSGKYKRVWHVQGVQGRGGILFHKGNLVRHSKGCTLVGKKHGFLSGQNAVLSSASGLNAMRKYLGCRDFILIVKRK